MDDEKILRPEAGDKDAMHLVDSYHTLDLANYDLP